jgi:hypothetical protein
MKSTARVTAAITYGATVDPETVAICHCTDCQTLSEARFAPSCRHKGCSSYAAEAKVWSNVPTAAESVRHSVPNAARRSTRPLLPRRFFSVCTGAIRQRAQLRRRQYWCRSALPWVMDLDP